MKIGMNQMSFSMIIQKLPTTMAQVVCSSPDNDTPIYEFMKKTFTERGDKRNLKKLDESVIFLDNGMVTCKDWASYVYLLHKAGGGTIKDKTEFTGIIIPILKAHCYTAKEKNRLYSRHENVSNDSLL